MRAIAVRRRSGVHCEITTAIRSAFSVELENRGRLAVPWILLEDSIPKAAMQDGRPRLKLEGPWMVRR